MNKRIDRLIPTLKSELGLFLSISFGIFLFILFFQPFPIIRFDFNNNLLFIAGLGAIIFLFMFFIRIAFSHFFQSNNNDDNEPLLPPYLKGFFFVALCSVSFAFYLRYVGLVEITFYIMLKVVIICLAPSLVLKIYDTINNLQIQNETLILEKKIVQKQVEKYEEDYLNKSIDFVSENSSESLNLLVAEVVLIKSADNYVEIVYMEGNIAKKKLIRNTLKNIELQLKQYTNFLRCHRICLVNVLYIEKLNTEYGSHWLSIKNSSETIPVSRQYLLKLKEAL